VVALLILVAGGLMPISGWATKFANVHNPHPPDARVNTNNYQSLSIGFTGPYRLLAEHEATCPPQGCYSFSSTAGPDSRDTPGTHDSSYSQDFSLNLGQSGPLSFRFSGRRFKMQVEF
jgi:hypothetical protein